MALLSMAALVAGAGHIVARLQGRKRWEFWLKPIPIAFFVCIALVASPALPAPYKALICAGLLFSMAGDVLLAWPRDRFVAGLLSFLIAHLLYIFAFATRAGVGWTWWVLAAAAAWGALMLALLWPHVDRKLRGPVCVYMAVIMVMLWQAAEDWIAIGDRSSALALGGALLFVVSDSTLALDKFRRPFAVAPVVVMVTYYLAQWLLALSVYAW